VFGNNKSDDNEAIREAADHVVNEVDGKQGVILKKQLWPSFVQPKKPIHPFIYY
jgi:hypothetical protein